MLLTDQPELHRAEPKTLRYRLLHTAARITRGQRRVLLRLALDPRARPSIPAPAAHPATGLTGQHHHRLHTLEDHGNTGLRAGALSRPQAGQDHHDLLILSPKAK